MKNGLAGIGIRIGQPIDQPLVFNGVGDDFSRISRVDFLILNPQGIDGDNGSLGTETVTSG